MRVTQLIEIALSNVATGVIFGYNDLIDNPDYTQAAIKALNRKVQKGELVKLSKGKFYKPEQSIFGVLKASEEEVVKDLLKAGDTITGYLTGLSIYNKLGLTTQVSSTIQIAKNTIRPALQRDYYKINFILQKNKITKENVPLLQLLDAIRYIKKIPDTTVEKSIARLSILLQQLTAAEMLELLNLSNKYPPSVRALLGFILEQQNIDTADLQRSLNPITTYNYGISDLFPSAKKWNIK